jgi:NAD(P)-dependent dehydrogenase (short-subunit alcohol dehydrogenase family)
MNRIDLAGRAAIVTGGARGIGEAAAGRLVESGAKVAIWDIDGKAAETAARRLGNAATAQAVDVTSEAQVTAARDAAIGAFGKVDILVCSAGIAGPNVKTWDYPLAEWNKVVSLDLTGVFLCCKALAPHMLANKWGRIVNIASIAGKEGNPNASAYSAAKAGVIGLTKSLGKELAGTDVLVNCITPAAIKTAIFDQLTQEHIDFMLSKIPMGRFGLVDEAAALIAWLSSPDCSFSTGGVFDLSGGRATY